MSKIQVTQEMKEATKEIISIYIKNNTVTVEEWDALTTEMAKSHPIIISIFMGFHKSGDFNVRQLGVIMKILATIWHYNGGVKAKKATKEDYEKAVKTNLDFAKYVEGESEKDKQKTWSDYLTHNTDSTAFAFVLFAIDESMEFEHLSLEETGRLAMELKSAHDCIENRVTA